jgi:hypothetical protein
MTDEIFIKNIGSPSSDARIYLAIRDAMAESCALPAELIYDTDDCDTLCNMGGLFGWDPTPLQQRLEDVLGKVLTKEHAAGFPMPGDRRSHFLGGGLSFLKWRQEDSGAVTFAGWAKAVVKFLTERGLIK